MRRQEHMPVSRAAGDTDPRHVIADPEFALAGWKHESHRINA
jgi:hypothetical protein